MIFGIRAVRMVSTSDRRWLHRDERGSIVAITNGTGGVIDINAYDTFGIPAAGNTGRFGYTGQLKGPQRADEMA